MKTHLKNYQKVLFVFSLFALFIFSACNDDDYADIRPSGDSKVESSDKFYAFREQKEEAGFPELSIQSSKLDERKLKELKYLFRKIDPSLYQVEIHQEGKVTDKWGSAAIRDLREVEAYYHPEFGSAAADEIITTVSCYIKTVWTSKLLAEGEYFEVVDRINQILDGSVLQRDIKLSEAQMTQKHLGALEDVLADVDPSLYTIEVHNEGKIVDQWGSAAIRDLRQVEAYYHPEFGGAVAANEIVTTVSNYIKTVWTSKMLESGAYTEQIARVEEILNHSTQM